jgi:hypothetical protein
VERVEGDDPVAALSVQRSEVLAFLRDQSDGAGELKYAPGKWTLAEVVGHVLDTERIMATRALCFARGEAGALPGFDQDAYVASGAFRGRALGDLADEFDFLRRANIAMFGALRPEDWHRSGTANGVRISVRAIAWILAGHCDHHMAILRERYLSGS